MALEYADLLVRAVRQLGTERKGFQSLFDAVDDMANEEMELTGVREAFVAMLKTPEPTSDVLELME
jgi:hypothetical protein